jgi:hypothetical protein
MQVIGISFTVRIYEMTFWHLTYPVWPKNGAFPHLLILKQALRSSDLKKKKKR